MYSPRNVTCNTPLLATLTTMQILRRPSLGMSVIVMRRLVALVVALAAVPCIAEKPKKTPASPSPLEPNLILGTQAIGGRYHFTDKPALVEAAEVIRDMGATCMKFALRLEPRHPEIHSLADLVTQDANCRQVLDMAFRDFFLWVDARAEGAWARGLKPDERAAEYRHVHDLTVRLLKTYSGTGKTFYLGHWEGDNMLRGDIGREGDTKMADAVRVQGFIDWLKIRQQAVDDAKRETPHQHVQVWHYTEVNHPTISLLEDRPSVANRVLPYVAVDFVSYSAYDSQNDPNLLRNTLDYLQSKLTPKPGLTDKRVFIGEYGFPIWKEGRTQHTPMQQRDLSVRVIQAAMEWGSPFVLYWELYNNELDPDGRHRGFWMIDDKGLKQPIYETCRAYYAWARRWILGATAKSGRPPTDVELRKAAVAYFDKVASLDSKP